MNEIALELTKLVFKDQKQLNPQEITETFLKILSALETAQKQKQTKDEPNPSVSYKINEFAW